MIKILLILKKIKPIHFLIIALVISSIVCSILWSLNKKKASEINRQTVNFEQLQEENIRQLTLSKKEFEQLNTTFKKKLDQVIKDNDLKLRQVKAATIIQTVYKDTGSTKIIYKEVVQLPDKSYSIQVQIDGQCWGMKGSILSFDPSSKLDVKERTANNSIQLIVTQKRRWLFWKRQEFKAFSDCGKIDVTKIDFIKK